MKIWIVTIGETTLLDSKNSRLLRSEIFSNKLIKKGAHVTFFNSTFDHVKKKHRYDKNSRIIYNQNLTYYFLKSIGYKKNISLNRLIDHFFIARNYKNVINELEVPDLIFCSMPTIELAYYSVKYGKKNCIPVIIDIRDLWPDIFHVNQKNKLKKIFLKFIFSISNYKLKYALANCSSIIGITDPIVKWAESKTKTNKYLKNKSFFLTKHFNLNSSESLKKSISFWDNNDVMEKDFNISLCASFNSVIDFDTIIKSARILNSAKINVKFILCGDGEKLESVRKEASDLKNIMFPGWIDSSQIETLMLRSKFGLLPYKNFFDFKMSIPNKVSEYLSYGLPVLTCLKGTVEELIFDHKCGVVYGESDPVDLANKIIYQVENYQKFSYKENSLNLYKQKFDSLNIYENMYNHILEIIEKYKLKESKLLFNKSSYNNK